ncbi:ABC transporter ATP-binding protein [Candidatus Daviesbacteria bacterium]|nr:ABC transporter ATP-binding protein [Candidatus Daviesbacteria bacterium]
MTEGKIMDKRVILEVKNLRKNFGPPAGGFTAIDNISFSLKEGEILGFLGPNGAGKSTTIYCILGLIVPDEGNIRIFGKDISKDRSEIFKEVNYASADFNLPWNLTIWENLLVYAKLYEVPEAKKRITELLQLFEMIDFRNTATRDLSTGLRARANLCKALLNKPRLLLLDEPMVSMDPDVVDKGINLLKQIQKEEKITILYTSHNMWEIEEIANNVIFLNHGKIVASGTPLELTQSVLKLEGDEPNLRDVFIHLSRSKYES